MKLFVWQDPYPVSYGGSLIYAVAETVDAAREQAEAGQAYSHGLSFADLDRKRPRLSLGEPTRILELPCAELQEWQE